MIMLSALLVSCLVAESVGFAEYTGDNYIEFVSVVENENRTQTWTYHVMITSQCSHWTIAWCGGPNSIVGASHDYVYGEDLGGESTTGLYGIQFKVDPWLQGTIVTYWFTLDVFYRMGAVEVGIANDSVEAVSGELLNTVTGPIVNYSITLSTKEKGINSMYVEAVAVTDSPFVNSVTFNWFGPFQTKGEAKRCMIGLGRPIWMDTDNEQADGFAAQHYMTENHLGYWYVNAIFEGGEHPNEAGEILDLSGISLQIPSVSLPLSVYRHFLPFRTRIYIFY